MKIIGSIIILGFLGFGIWFLTRPEQEQGLEDNPEFFDESVGMKSSSKNELSRKSTLPESKEITKAPTGSKTSGYTGVDWDYVDTLKVLPSGEMEVTGLKVGNEIVALGDILVTKLIKKGTRKALLKIRRWEEGIVPYVIENGLSNVAEIREAIDFINNQTQVNWRPRNGEEDYVVITTGEEHCLSYLGRAGGEQAIKLSAGCNKGEILHEMFHAMGMYHEHARGNRDEYIKIYWGNIEKKYWDQFKKIPNSLDYEFQGPIDLDSILMYGPAAFAMDQKFLTISLMSGDTFSANKNLPSDLDIEKLNTIYMVR